MSNAKEITVTVEDIKRHLAESVAHYRQLAEGEITGSVSRVVYLSKALALADALKAIVADEALAVEKQLEAVRRGA
jgi:hypothetical protein